MLKNVPALLVTAAVTLALAGCGGNGGNGGNGGGAGDGSTPTSSNPDAPAPRKAPGPPDGGAAPTAQPGG